MDCYMKSDDLAELYELLTEDKQSLPEKHALTRFERELLAVRSTVHVDLGDYLITTERRRYSAVERLFDSLINQLSIPRQWIYRKPDRPQDTAHGTQGLTAIDATALLIGLEALGLSVDPSRLVKALEGEVSERDQLTSSEMDIFLYQHRVGKMRLVLRADRAGMVAPFRQEQHKDASGYRFTMTWKGETAISLEVRGPRFREPKLQESITCDYCKMSYVTNSSADTRMHRAEHERTRRLMEHFPNKRFAKRLATVADGELVDPTSPFWMHGAVYERARAFRREFSYDFVQWPGSSTQRAPANWHGYLFAAGVDGAIAGACGLKQEESGTDKGQWGLQWIWIAPGFRRTGLLKARWQHLLCRYGDFNIEPPISEAMQAFIRRHGSEAQKLQVQSTL